MTSPEAGVKPMVVSTEWPPWTAARLAPAPRCARMTRPRASSGPPTRASSSIRIRVRQSMEAIAPDAGGLEPPGDRHDLGDAGHVVMKCGVEAHNLG